MIEDLLAGVPGPIAERVLAALMLPPDERAELIGRLHTDEETWSFGEVFIDLDLQIRRAAATMRSGSS